MPRAMAASIAGSDEAGWTPIKAAVRTVPRRNPSIRSPGCCKAPLTIDLVSLDLGEPGGVEDPQEILGFLETSAGGRGLRGLWIVMRRYRVEEQLSGNVFGRCRPTRERDPPVGPQDPPRLGRRLDGIRQVVDPEIRDDSVERGIGKRQRFRIPFFKASASPFSKRISGCAVRASPIIAAAKSSPVGMAPRSRAAPATRPGPQARSSTCIPAPTRAASST